MRIPRELLAPLACFVSTTGYTANRQTHTQPWPQKTLLAPTLFCSVQLCRGTERLPIHSPFRLHLSEIKRKQPVWPLVFSIEFVIRAWFHTHHALRLLGSSDTAKSYYVFRCSKSFLITTPRWGFSGGSASAAAAAARPSPSASTGAPSPRRSRSAPDGTPRCRTACHLCEKGKKNPHRCQQTIHADPSMEISCSCSRKKARSQVIRLQAGTEPLLTCT